MQGPYAITPDGKTVLFIQRTPERSFDILTLSLGKDRETRPLIATEHDERRPTMSPDGRFVAYQSDESGRFEVYVRPFPDVAAGKWQVSSGGGTSPLWAPGGEIFYRRDEYVYQVTVSVAPTFSWGTPKRLWDSALPPDRDGAPSYTLTPDGNRFLLAKPLRSDEFCVVLNWFNELERLVPTK